MRDFTLFTLLDFFVQSVYNTINPCVLDFSQFVTHISSSFVSTKSIYLNNLLLFRCSVLSDNLKRFT